MVTFSVSRSNLYWSKPVTVVLVAEDSYLGLALLISLATLTGTFIVTLSSLRSISDRYSICYIFLSYFKLSMSAAPFPDFFPIDRFGMSLMGRD